MVTCSSLLCCSTISFSSLKYYLCRICLILSDYKRIVQNAKEGNDTRVVHYYEMNEYALALFSFRFLLLLETMFAY